MHVLMFDRVVRGRVTGSRGAALLPALVDAMSAVEPQLIDTDWDQVLVQAARLTNRPSLVVLLTAGSLRLCESVRGVSTCGGGPGFVLLVAVMVAMVLLGGTLLRLARVPDPMSTSFLAVGLTCVLSLLFLVDVLQEWWMVIVIPVMTVATFLLSHWVTTSVIEPAEG